MTDPLEQDVLSFLAGRKPTKPKDPLEQDVLSFLSLRQEPQEISVDSGLPPSLSGLGASDYFMQAGLDATLADLEKQPEFAAQLAKDRARGLSDDQILAKIQAGQQVAPQRPDWAGGAPSTAEASNDVLYGQPTGIETAVETGLRAGANVVRTAGALMERTGRKLNLPEPEPERTPEQAAVMAKMRDIYSVGQPGTPVQQAVTGGVVQPALETLDREVMAPLAQKGVEIQAGAQRAQEAIPRPAYARDFVEGLKTDPLKTLAISGAENLPQLAITIGAAIVAPELGLAAAWAQEAGGAYQEAKQRGATEEEAQQISGIIGVTNMFLEYMPAGKALEALNGASKKGAKALLYDMVEQGVSEGTTESFQEANQMIVTAAVNAKDQGFTFDEFRDRIMEAGLSALVLGGATGAATHAGSNVGADEASSSATAPITNPARQEEAAPGLIISRGKSARIDGDVIFVARDNDGNEVGAMSVSPVVDHWDGGTGYAIHKSTHPPASGVGMAIQDSIAKEMGRYVGPFPGYGNTEIVGDSTTAEPGKSIDGEMSIVEQLDSNGSPVLVALSPYGNELGRLRYTSDPSGGFTVDWIQTGSRGQGIARKLYRAAYDREGQYKGATLNRTKDGSGLVARLRGTDPDIFEPPIPMASRNDPEPELEADVLSFLESRDAQPPVEAMQHAGSDVSPEAINRTAAGNRYYRISRGGEVVPIIADSAAVDLRVNPGEIKVLVTPDGDRVVEQGKPNAAQQLAMSGIAAVAPVQELPVESFEIADEGDDILAQLGVQRVEGGPNADVRVESWPPRVRAGEPGVEQFHETDPQLRPRDYMGANPDEDTGFSPDSGSQGPAQPAGGRDLRTAGGSVEREARNVEAAAPKSRAQEPPSGVSPAETVAVQEAPGQEPSLPTQEPVAAEAVPEPAREPDRGAESLPARIMRPRQKAGQEGFAILPAAIKKPLVDWVRKRMTQQGLAPRYYLDLKIRRDNQLAARAARLDAYSIDLARAIRRYKGPLTQKQLKIYLDDAYRGMNLSGISGPMDEAQAARVREQRQLSEVATQRLREDSPGSKFPREARMPDQSSIGRKQLREMATRQGVSEDALVSIARKEGGQSAAAAPEFLPLLREMRSIQDDLARTLRRYGLLNDTSIRELEREFGLYVHRQYEAPRNPKFLKWVKDQPLWNRAYDLTKSLWDRQFAADRAEAIVDDLKLKAQKGGKAQAVADVRRTMLDPSTRDQLLDEYKLDAQKFDDAHNRAKAKLPDMPESEILGMLQSYVEASGNRPVLPGGVPEGSKDLTALKRRGRKDDLERLLKGEVRSIDWNFLTTSLKMATIIAQHRFLVDLEQAGKGDIFTEKMEVRNAGTKDEKALTKPIDPDFYVKSIETAKGREPGIDQRTIKRGSKKTAPLSGLFTTEEVMEALNEQFDFKSYPDWLKYYMRGAVMAKGAATAGSAISLARNVWSQPLVLMANGVNPLNIKRFLRAGMDSYPRAVGNTSRTRLARIERYVELGFVDQGADIGDIKRMEKRAQVLSDDVPHGAGSTGGRMIRETARGARNLYQAPDNQGKIQIFEALLPLYKKALPDLTATQVEEHLAAKMRDTTQNYPMSPPLVKAISNFPFIAPFVTFRMEVIRNLYHAARVASEEVRSDNQELRKIGLRRVAGMSAALALPMATAFAARAWLNLDDDDDDATRRFMAPWNKNSTIAFLSGIDSEGNVKFIDLSFMDYYAAAKAPFEALLRGDAEGLAASITDPFGEDVLTKNVLDVTTRGGQTKDGHDVYNKQDTTLTKSIAITKHLGAPLTPGVIKQVARTMDPERDKSSEIMGLFGVRKTVINIPKELRRRVKMFQDAINDSRWIEKKVIRKEGTEEVYSAAQKRSIVALRRNIEEFIKDIQAARQLGLDEDAIAAALVESGLGKGNPAKGQFGEVGLLLDGDVDALVERYIALNEKWGDEKRNFFGMPRPKNKPNRVPGDVEAAQYWERRKAVTRRATALARRVAPTADISGIIGRADHTLHPGGADEFENIAVAAIGRDIKEGGDNARPVSTLERLSVAARRILRSHGFSREQLGDLRDIGLGDPSQLMSMPSVAKLIRQLPPGKPRDEITAAAIFLARAGATEDGIAEQLTGGAFGEEKRNFTSREPRPRTSDEVDLTNAQPWRNAAPIDIALAMARGQRHYKKVQPGGEPETEQQKKNRREIGATAEVWQQTLRDRGIEQPNGKLFGLGEYFLGEEVAKQGIAKNPATALGKMGAAGRRAIQEKGPALGREMGWVQIKRSLLDGFTTESVPRMTEILKTAKRLHSDGLRGADFWNLITKMFDDKDAFVE